MFSKIADCIKLCFYVGNGYFQNKLFIIFFFFLDDLDIDDLDLSDDDDINNLSLDEPLDRTAFS